VQIDCCVGSLSQWRHQDFVTGGEVRFGSMSIAMYLSCDTKTFHDNESTHIT